MGQSYKKWVTPGHISSTWKNGSHLEMWVTLKNGSYFKKGSHLEKRIILQKLGHTKNNGLHLKKWLTLRKMGHIGKMSYTWENR